MFLKYFVDDIKTLHILSCGIYYNCLLKQYDIIVPRPNLSCWAGHKWQISYGNHIRINRKSNINFWCGVCNSLVELHSSKRQEIQRLHSDMVRKTKSLNWHHPSAALHVVKLSSPKARRRDSNKKPPQELSKCPVSQ